MLISGSLRPDGSVAIRPAFRLDIRVHHGQLGDYTLELLDGTGTVLAAHPFEMVTAAADGVGGALGGEINGFSLSVPFVQGIDQIRVLKNGAVLGGMQDSAAQPSAALAGTNARVEAGRLRAGWDGRPGLTYLVRVSLDGGQIWQTVGVNLDKPGLDLPLPEGTGERDLRLEIYASDGINTERLRLGPDSTMR